MNCSEARLIANRQNAARSTGPKTLEGKERSKQNSLKHGMAGEGLVLPVEDLAEVEARTRILHAEMAPKSAMGAILIRQLALLSVRMERGARQEIAAIATRVRHAGEVFDREQLDRAEQLLAGIAGEPRKIVEQLRRSPEGIDLLIRAWRDLKGDLNREPRAIWSDDHYKALAHLQGLTRVAMEGSRLEALIKATWGNVQYLSESEKTGLDPQSVRLWARNLVNERIDGEIADLEQARAALDHALIALDRAEAGDRALFDPSREASLARRYESEARRCFFRVLKEFRQIEADFSEQEKTLQAAELASSRGNPPRAERDPRPSAEAVPQASFQPVLEVSRGRIRRENRRERVKIAATAGV